MFDGASGHRLVENPQRSPVQGECEMTAILALPLLSRNSLKLVQATLFA